jgi:hypothetical protein
MAAEDLIPFRQTHLVIILLPPLLIKSNCRIEHVKIPSDVVGK